MKITENVFLLKLGFSRNWSHFSFSIFIHQQAFFSSKKKYKISNGTIKNITIFDPTFCYFAFHLSVFLFLPIHCFFPLPLNHWYYSSLLYYLISFKFLSLSSFSFSSYLIPPSSSFYLHLLFLESLYLINFLFVIMEEEKKLNFFYLVTFVLFLFSCVVSKIIFTLSSF